ncbi:MULTISPECIES: putative quinol monooxygenase [unclassified Pseudomonas]|uniref:putative quinol monooxygenase n=1 Tax=unclassified Pseudomonas TaxID=196821 RepID=UPI001CBE9017|nr:MULTISPECIES: putative quinol monooxygenase [unclassified Pseudomonas]
MLLIVGEVRLPVDKVQAAKPAMERVITASREEAGCLDYTYAEDVLDPGLIRVKETWLSKAAFDEHSASSHMAQWRSSEAAGWITHRRFQIFEVDDPLSV